MYASVTSCASVVISLSLSLSLSLTHTLKATQPHTPLSQITSDNLKHVKGIGALGISRRREAMVRRCALCVGDVWCCVWTKETKRERERGGKVMDVLSKHGLLCVMCVISSVWFPQGCGGDSGKNERRKLTLSVCASLDPCVCVCVCRGNERAVRSRRRRRRCPNSQRLLHVHSATTRRVSARNGTSRQKQSTNHINHTKKRADTHTSEWRKHNLTPLVCYCMCVRTLVNVHNRCHCRDFGSKIGQVSCSKCNAKFECSITDLTEPIDMYSDWIDACENVNDD